VQLLVSHPRRAGVLSRPPDVYHGPKQPQYISICSRRGAAGLVGL